MPKIFMLPRPGRLYKSNMSLISSLMVVEEENPAPARPPSPGNPVLDRLRLRERICAAVAVCMYREDDFLQLEHGLVVIWTLYIVDV